MIPELSVALVLYNSSGSLAGCLAGLDEAVTRGWAEVIAVDNSSEDGSGELLRRRLPQARLISNETNRGFAAGANAAMACARARYWLLLNPDAEPSSPTALTALVEWMDAHPGIGVASPAIIDVDGRTVQPGRAFPSIANTLLELSRLHRLLPVDVRARILRGPYWSGGDQLDCDWIPGTVMIVRAAAARAVGPLDERFFMYGEDIDWCWRFKRAGWHVGVCSSVTFRHEGRHSATQTFGATETDRRIAAGTLGALRTARGDRYARLFAYSMGLAHVLEAVAPGRSHEHRRSMLGEARVWWRLAARQRRSTASAPPPSA